MEVVNHPYLEGVKCRDDGAVFIPASGAHKGHWTFGTRRNSGYRQVGTFGRHYPAHRLICEAFHGKCPEGRPEVDHIDRDPSNNKPENLRWCSQSENNRNRGVYAQCGISSVDDPAAYWRARYANNSEYRERRKAYARINYAKKKAKAAQK